LRASKENPAATARWLETLTGDQLAPCGTILVTSWAKSDPGKAFTWALQHGISLTGDISLEHVVRDHGNWDSAWWAQESSGSPLREAARAHPAATVEWLRTLPAGAERERLCEVAILENPKNADLTSLLPEISPEGIPRAVGYMVAYSRNDPVRLEQLESELPAGIAREAYWRAMGVTAREPLPRAVGPERDAMLTGMICRSGEAPDRAWELIQQVEDPQRRMNAFDDMMYHLRPQEQDEHRTDAPARHEAFRQWLNNPAVPEEWKTPWLHFLNAENIRTAR
jgi:hypothetical protein